MSGKSLMIVIAFSVSLSLLFPAFASGKYKAAALIFSIQLLLFYFWFDDATNRTYDKEIVTETSKGELILIKPNINYVFWSMEHASKYLGKTETKIEETIKNAAKEISRKDVAKNFVDFKNEVKSKLFHFAHENDDYRLKFENIEIKDIVYMKSS